MNRLDVVRCAARLAGVLLLVGCFKSAREFEDWSPEVPGTHFKTIATIAGASERGDIRLMIQVREALQKAGINAVRAGGRWSTVIEAVGQLCGSGADQPIDGVLMVSYNHVVLYNCETSKPAYEIQGAPEKGGVGLGEMTKRLLRYLRPEKPPSS